MSSPFPAVKEQFSNQPAGFPECRCPADQISLEEWCALMKHMPPDKVMKLLKERGMSLQDIDDATGSGVNLDYYPVTISQMPTIDGHELTADELLDHIQANPGQFFDPTIANFQPYDSEDASTWAADGLGAVFNISMGTPGLSNIPFVGGWLGNLDDGSVVASQATNRNWIFTTIWNWGDLGHPVSGNREFGYTDFGNGNTVFYTRGADRLAGNVEALGNWATSFVTVPLAQTGELLNALRAGPYAPFTLRDMESIPDDRGVGFMMADRLWKGYQRRIADFVNNNGGVATVGKSVSQRADYEAMKERCANR